MKMTLEITRGGDAKNELDQLIDKMRNGYKLTKKEIKLANALALLEKNNLI